jgi:hypothetical protein
MGQPSALRISMLGRVIKYDELCEIWSGGLGRLAGGGEASDDEVNEPNSARRYTCQGGGCSAEESCEL